MTSESLAQHRRLGDVAGEALCLNNLTALQNDLGDCASALANARASLALCERHGLVGTRGFVLANLAELTMKLGELDAARGHAASALELSLATGNRSTEAWIRLLLVQIAIRHDDLAAARQALRESLELALAIGRPLSLLAAMTVFSDLLAAQGERRAAARLLRFAARHPERTTEGRHQPAPLRALADTDGRRRRRARAAAGDWRAIVAETPPGTLPAASLERRMTLAALLARGLPNSGRTGRLEGWNAAITPFAQAGLRTRNAMQDGSLSRPATPALRQSPHERRGDLQPVEAWRRQDGSAHFRGLQESTTAPARSVPRASWAGPAKVAGGDPPTASARALRTASLSSRLTHKKTQCTHCPPPRAQRRGPTERVPPAASRSPTNPWDIDRVSSRPQLRLRKSYARRLSKVGDSPSCSAERVCCRRGRPYAKCRPGEPFHRASRELGNDSPGDGRVGAGPAHRRGAEAKEMFRSIERIAARACPPVSLLQHPNKSRAGEQSNWAVSD